MIVVVGEALVDIVVDADGDSVEEVGGSPMNVAVGLGRLDVPALLITAAGHDERGGRIVAHVEASGAELVVAPTADGRTATATAHLDPHGVASYDFDISWDLPQQELPGCDALHVGSLGTVLEPGRLSVLDLVDQAWARDVFLSFDPNVRPAFLDDRDQAWRDIESLAERCRLVKLSDEDVERLHPGADPDDIARSLLGGESTELVVVTRGPHGATAYVDERVVTVAAPRIELVDTVGAGDSFMAAVLGILHEADAFAPHGPGMPTGEDDLRRLLGGAVEVAAITCSRRGANPPTRPQLSDDWPG